MRTLDPNNCTTQELQAILSSAVAPRPIALASTIDAEGRPNLSPFSFYNIFSTNPPILIFSPARRVRDNSIKHTLENAIETKEVVINVVSYNIVQQMSLSSTEYPREVNEFTKAGLGMLPSDLVKPFRVKESPIQMECRVNEVVALGKNHGAGNLVICEVLKLHLSESILNSDQSINQEQLDLVARGGGSYYVRANKGFFQIPKPLRTRGIGVDGLPHHIKSSTILTGNDLGILANVESLPTDSQKTPKTLAQNLDQLSITQKHQLAQNHIEKGDIDTAWYILLN